MRRHFLLVSNAMAGRGKQERVRAVVDELCRRGCSVVEDAPDQQSILDKQSELANFDAVIAAGGDGTVRRLLKTVAGQTLPVGMIPTGTGNVLAHEIGLFLSPSLIADVLIAGPAISVNKGLVGKEPFLLMVGIGFDGDVIHHLNVSLKHRFGKIAYMGAVLGALRRFQPRFKVKVDGQSHTATWMVVANARHYGGGFLLTPGAGIMQKAFQVVLFQSSSRLVRLRQLFALAIGNIDNAPHTSVVTGRVIRIEGARRDDLLAQVDGDPLAACPDRITHGEAIRLIVPSRFTR